MKTVVIDKDFTERNGITTAFPHASVKICQFHVIKYLSKEICEDTYGISKNNRIALRYLFALIAKSSNMEEYFQYYEEIKNLSSDSFISYFNKNWHESRKEWVLFFLLNLRNLSSYALSIMDQDDKQS